jgi:hypothetical protein
MTAMPDPLPSPVINAALAGAMDEAASLLAHAENFATMLSELDLPDLPAAGRAEPMQLRAIASLYLASSLEAAGLIEAADDFVRLLRTGVVTGDLGDSGDIISQFWSERQTRMNLAERQALFARLFGSPTIATDMTSASNSNFDELMLDLCDAIIKALESGGTRKIQAAMERMAENIGGVASDALLIMAREILGSLSQSIAILNNENVRRMLLARSMWDAVSAIDRKLRRPPRGTLNHLRRGRAGMAVLAWLADVTETSDLNFRSNTQIPEMISAAAVDWIDETVSLLRQEEANQSPATAAPPTRNNTNPASANPAWAELAN